MSRVIIVKAIGIFYYFGGFRDFQDSPVFQIFRDFPIFRDFQDFLVFQILQDFQDLPIVQSSQVFEDFKTSKSFETSNTFRARNNSKLECDFPVNLHHRGHDTTHHHRSSNDRRNRFPVTPETSFLPVDTANPSPRKTSRSITNEHINPRSLFLCFSSSPSSSSLKRFNLLVR